MKEYRYLNVLTDEELALKAQTPEGEQAYVLLVSRYQEEVRLTFRYQYLLTEFQDVSQDFWAKKFTPALNKYEDRGNGSFKGWLFKVVGRYAADCRQARRRRIAPFIDLDDVHMQNIHSYDDESFLVAFNAEKKRLRIKEILWSTLNELPKDWRRLMYDYYRHGLTTVEIAAIYEMNASTVRATLYRARKYLEPLLRDALSDLD